MKYKDLGTMLSKDEMKNVKGGFIPPGGGGCIPFQGACVNSPAWVCCNYTDGSPVYCSGAPGRSGLCNLVA